jgi:hypothetical protein
LSNFREIAVIFLFWCGADATPKSTLRFERSPNFRNLAVSQIIADSMDEMGLKLPATHVDIADIRRKYHAAEREADGSKRQTKEADKVK